MSEGITVYELVGADGFHQLVEEFYARVEADPVLRPLFPEDLEPGKRWQELFLIQYWGGPADYNQQRGHPRLRMRHSPYPIHPEAAQHWLNHMLEAIDVVGIEEPARTAMREYFERAAPVMINHYPLDSMGQD